LVYGEELIDKAMIHSTRVVNEKTNTIDFVSGKKILFRYQESSFSGFFLFLLFRSTTNDHHPCIFQMGTNSAVNALKTAELVINDVAGVDVNMGCPKDFSVKGGMGVALMKDRENVVDILTTLRKNIAPEKSVTCKIRILPNEEDTIDVCRMIEQCGVTACKLKQKREENA
jgi:tRNA-dihydrouridine synthase 2